MIAGLEYSIKPFANNKGAISNLQTALMANMYFRANRRRYIGTGHDKYIIRQEISLVRKLTLESTSDLFPTSVSGSREDYTCHLQHLTVL